MNKSHIINAIKKLLYNNYTYNLSENEQDILINKIEELNSVTISSRALSKIYSLANEINDSLISGRKDEPEFSDLLKKLSLTNTNTERLEIINKIMTKK